MKPVTTDENGLACGVAYRGGALDGISLQHGGQRVCLALRTSEDDAYRIVLDGVRSLHVNELRRRNIVSTIRVLPAKVARADAPLHAIAEQRLRIDVGGSVASTDDKVFLLESSKGADLIALCTEVMIETASEGGGVAEGRPTVVFEVVHVHVFADGEEDSKRIGFYATRTAAEQAILRVRGAAGFVEHPDSFDIIEHDLGKTHWLDGFVTWDPEKGDWA